MEIRKKERKKERISFFSLIVAAAQCAAIAGAAFADSYTQDGKPCPPECVSDTMEIVTWYPSPYNEYEELRLYPKFSADESECNSEDKLGLMYYNKDEQALKVCWQDPGDLSYSWEKIGSEQSGLSRLGNYATGAYPNCSNTLLGALVYDTTEKRPYVCALNASNSPVWKPLDSDYDRDGVTDAVDANDNDFNDATAVEANVETGKTFYARGGSRRIGTLVSSDIGGVCLVAQIYGCNDYGSCLYWKGNGWQSISADYGWFEWVIWSIAGNAFARPYETYEHCYNRNGQERRLVYTSNPCSCPAGYTIKQIHYEGPDGCGHPIQSLYVCKKS